MDLLQQFCRHCAAERLVQPPDRLLLAVSGGLDSCVLLDLFCRLREDPGFIFVNSEGKAELQLAVGHVNHQLRGSESDADEDFVKTLAQKANLPFYSQRIDVRIYARAHKLSLETAGRELRYQALEKFRENWQARAIVVAHTLDDQAETILDHILRGCGLKGLSGMTARTDIQIENLQIENERESKAVAAFTGVDLSSNAQPLKGRLQTKILRPLLPFSRAQLEAYARFRPLRWREDRTNTDMQFRRNRLRQELLPLLKTRFNPKIAESLQRLANIAAASENYFQAEAEACLSRTGGIIKELQSDKIILDLEQFWKYYDIIQYYIIRAVIRRLRCEPVEPTFSETTRILEVLQKKHKANRNNKKPTTHKRYIWHKQIEVLVDRDDVVFQRQKDSDKEKAKKFQISVAVGERCEIPGTTSAIVVEKKMLPGDWRQLVNSHSQFVDAAKVQGELRVRFPQPGDRFVPLRTIDHAESGGTKKLSDFFTDLKVPLHRRRATPILEADHIIWVCGYRLDNRFKITAATRAVLHLQLFAEQPLTM
jgi:tRNA(Ile)-lysidine synthase